MEKVINYPNGDQYIGQIQDNKKEGIGAYTYHTGARYEGQFHNDRRHGRGIYYFTNHLIYQHNQKLMKYCPQFQNILIHINIQMKMEVQIVKSV